MTEVCDWMRRMLIFGNGGIHQSEGFAAMIIRYD